jgi:hypothetical protein
MAVLRVHPDPVVQTAIVDAATAFEARITAKLNEYRQYVKSGARLVPTERRLDREITI